MQIVWSRLDQMLRHWNVCLHSIHKDSIIASSLATVQNNSNCSCPRPFLNVCIAIFVQVFHFHLKFGLSLHQNRHVMFGSFFERAYLPQPCELLACCYVDCTQSCKQVVCCKQQWNADSEWILYMSMISSIFLVLNRIRPDSRYVA